MNHLYRKQSLILPVLTALLSCGLGKARAQYIPVDFTAVSNAHLQDNAGPGLWLPESLTGSLILGGVPFYLPPTGLNFWHSSAVTGGNPRTLDIPVNLAHITELHTLIGSYWGAGGPASYASLEFFGSAGGYYRKDLVGNDDIRDFNDYEYTTNLNGVTAVTVASYIGFPNDQRLDKQQIILPAAFAMQTLTRILLSDNGADGFQRVFLAGVTAKTSPTDYAVLRGTLNLEYIFPAAPAQPITFTLRPLDNSGDETQTVSVLPDGSFVLVVTKKNGVLHIKGEKYLAANIPVDASNGDVSGLTAYLYSADANNDNRIDIGDFALLVNAYNGDATVPGSGYDPVADFNLDGRNDVADFGLLVNNYGLIGDP